MQLHPIVAAALMSMLDPWMKASLFIVDWVDRACLMVVITALVISHEAWQVSSCPLLLGLVGFQILVVGFAVCMKESPLHCLWTEGVLEECSSYVLETGVL